MNVITSLEEFYTELESKQHNPDELLALVSRLDDKTFREFLRDAFSLCIQSNLVFSTVTGLIVENLLEINPEKEQEKFTSLIDGSLDKLAQQREAIQGHVVFLVIESIRYKRELEGKKQNGKG